MVRFMNSPKLSLLLLLCLVILFNKGQTDFPCSDTTYAQNSTFHTNLKSLLSSLSYHANQSDGFYNTTVHDDSNAAATVYGRLQCLRDATVRACEECVSIGIKGLLQQCPNNTGAFGWYDNCYLRYSDHNFFSEKEEDPMKIYVFGANATNPERFMNRLGETLQVVAKEASEGGSKKFATKTVDYDAFEPIYTMAQCTSDLNGVDCLHCLHKSINSLPRCCYGDVGGVISKPSCFLRHETYAFYQEPPPPPPPPPSKDKSKISAGTIIAAVVHTSIFIFQVSLCFLCLKYWRARMSASVPRTAEISSAESLHFDLDTIRLATNDFSPENKLGQGGYGEVYKGILPGGQELAVKRLSGSSKQGVPEFKAEVATIAKLQHRNLVRFIGFCLDEEERILVYEFLPNKSLDNFLFGPENRGKLNWSNRFNIIEGIARGILYLHEDSQFKIIHRDLKSSNILLDEDLNPKISDFGMARIFETDQTQDSTSKVVGTFGYIAPEYAIHGHISVKSDIYSFGVLILEIIGGRKNTSFHASNYAENLLTYAWKLWREGKALELLDPSLRNSCTGNEVIKCIHISLLCIQENPALRPAIQSIMVMLSSHSITMPQPTEPAFLFDGGHRMDQSRSKSSQRSVDEDPISDLYPR